jgi:hypothetical protein
LKQAGYGGIITGRMRLLAYRANTTEPYTHRLNLRRMER